ncbi:LysR substrate-binding domain-containing protein [Dickeya oryzae]|uniref:LysR substrate-binding domain-containing protein n=1 Tax=Dickeya oryzae TaxID=1240404 RepID=A0AB39IIQ0_9GAMM|nr:LysR substrate-binding domain-containing protein [Dickeya oryzae]MBP2849273.1 hypothetical protein [Dickeya oryzae]MCA6994505.1 hypothetical protein [Dickeya oryzae]
MPDENDILVTSTQPTALLQAALHGLGVALLPTLLGQDDSQKGNLTQVLTSWRPKSVTFFAIHLLLFIPAVRR